MKTTKALSQWWLQFPAELRKITICRFFASIGAGGVIYFTSLVFNNLSFSATEIGVGFCFAATSGTLARLTAGFWLDKSKSFSSPLKTAALLAITADLLLFSAETHNDYLLGELFLGGAAGFYWPSIELAIAKCSKYGSSAKGFALARSADALGISIGALLGLLLVELNHIRLIYMVEIICMLILLIILKDNFKSQSLYEGEYQADNISTINNFSLYKILNLIKNLYPIFLISILSTGILSLMQIGLQLDLVKGGIYRPRFNESIIGWIVSYKLILLLIMQWPIGKWLSEKSVNYGLKLSNISLLAGCLLLGLSSMSYNGLYIIIIGLIPLSAGIAMFLPTATQAIVEISPKGSRGIALSIYSQCFGISFLVFPILAGKIIDTQGNGMLIWILISICCVFVYPLTNRLSISKL